MGSSLEELITDAVDEILAHEDYARFRTWLAEEAPRRQPQWARLAEAELRARVQRFARAIWNATPLPGNGLRPRPLPSPERNDPCPCGSGVKYKKCCATAERDASALQFDPEAMLSLVAERLDPFRAAELGESLPPAAATDLAMHLAELDNPRAALAMVEKRFAEPAKAGPRDIGALAVMLDCYGDLGLAESLHSLVGRLAAELPQPLHGVLWEYAASAAARAGDLDSAWQWLDQAKSLEPDNPRLDPLAVTFLMAVDDYEQAGQRARLALERARRERWDLPRETLDLLADIAAEPAATHRRLTLVDAEPYVARFESWLARVADRPLPAYSVVPVDGDANAGRLAAPAETAFVEDGWIDAYYGVAFEEDPFDEDEEDDDDETEDVDGDEDLGRPEDDAVEDDELDEDDDDFEEDEDDDPLEEDQWSADNAETWLAFLESQPAAFDSLAVLSDLGGIVAQVTYERSRRIGAGLLQPLLARATAILDRATAAAPGLTLPVDEPDNEPALKLLVQAESLPEEAGRQYLDRLLALDPSDPFLLHETEEPM
jgi:hypothetical protein